MLDSLEPERFDEVLRRPWARQALASFPAGTLRRFVPLERLSAASDQLLPFCEAGVRSGFLAARQWPQLAEIGTGQQVAALISS